MTHERLLIKSLEAVRMLSISEKNLWTLSAPRGPIPTIRVGERSIRYSIAALKKWIDDQQTSQGGDQQ
jgi:predicted DNA-binding transcriptional regulator AlpA